jgi:hypothetical protein
MERRTAALRAGAKALRANPNGIPGRDLALMVADWIDAEAATLGEMEPFAELVNAIISNERHDVPAYIQFGRTESGEIKLNSDTSTHAERIIEALEDAS